MPLPVVALRPALKVDEPRPALLRVREALRNGWTVRRLERQITTMFYERTLASKNKAAMLRKGAVQGRERRREDSHGARFRRAAGGLQGVHGVSLLLDTHALLWFLDDDPQLSATAKGLIEDPANRKFVSMATAGRSPSRSD